MHPFVSHTGKVLHLDRANVDTDQIVPKEFLKGITRDGLGQALFACWRYQEDGTPNPAFVLNHERYLGASVLVAGRNFGSGSSREHAVWALMDYGFRVVIAPMFADIFYNNSFKNGMLPITLPEEHVREIMVQAAATDGYRLTVDLQQCRVTDGGTLNVKFSVDPFRRHCLLNGLDDIGLTLQHEAGIAAYEDSLPTWCS